MAYNQIVESDLLPTFQTKPSSPIFTVRLSCGCIYYLNEYAGQQEIKHAHHNSLGRLGSALPIKRKLSEGEFIKIVTHYLVIQQMLGYEVEGVTISAIESDEISGNEPGLSKTNPTEYAHIIEEIKRNDDSL